MARPSFAVVMLAALLPVASGCNQAPTEAELQAAYDREWAKLWELEETWQRLSAASARADKGSADAAKIDAKMAEINAAIEWQIPAVTAAGERLPEPPDHEAEILLAKDELRTLEQAANRAKVAIDDLEKSRDVARRNAEQSGDIAWQVIHHSNASAATEQAVNIGISTIELFQEANRLKRRIAILSQL